MAGKFHAGQKYYEQFLRVPSAARLQGPKAGGFTPPMLLAQRPPWDIWTRMKGNFRRSLAFLARYALISVARMTGPVGAPVGDPPVGSTDTASVQPGGGAVG